MRRYGLGALAFACGLVAAASAAPAQTPGLTVPPALRAPSAAAAASEPAKPAAAKPKAKKRAAKPAPRATESPTASAAPDTPRRLYPPDIDRDEGGGGSSVKPSFNPSGRVGFGGRF